MRNFLLSITALILLAAPSANALVEARLHYGMLSATPKKMNDSLVESGLPKVGLLTGIGFDGLVNLPAVPIGFGLRYESQSFKASGTVSGNSTTYNVGFTRMALLLNYRLINTLVFLGPIASFGITNSSYYKIDITGFGNSEYKSSSGTTISVGVEGGAKLGLFLIGAELGYLSGDFGTPAKADGEKLDGKLDLSGIYAKAHIGVGF